MAFEQTGIEEFSSAVQFDAVVGRCILVFQPDPPAFLRHVMRFIGPNGVLALHEISLRHRFRSNPTVSLWDGDRDWLVAGFNPERDVATRLVEHFMVADPHFPTMFAEIPIGGGASSPLYAWTAETIRSLLPAIAASGIATAGKYRSRHRGNGCAMPLSPQTLKLNSSHRSAVGQGCRGPITGEQQGLQSCDRHPDFAPR